MALGPTNLNFTKMLMKFGLFFLRPAGTIPLSAVHSEDVVLFLLICVEIVFYLKLTLELDELFRFE